jgi:hypothetical protein
MRTQIIRTTLAAAVAAVALSACQAPQAIQNIDGASVTPSTAKSLSAAQVRAAIITAGTSLGWKVTDAGPGKLEGTLNLRAHTAVVEIPYNASTYSIKHKRTEGLNEGNGTIHRNYNNWVGYLDKAIRTEISRL